MSGFINDNEGLDETAQQIAPQLTGLNNVYMEQLFTFSNINRDTGGRIVSVAYFSLIKINEYL